MKKILFKSLALIVLLMCSMSAMAAGTDSGSASEHIDGTPFTNAYDYEFSTEGTSVSISVTENDNFQGLVAYLWNYTNGFAETQMTVNGHTASITLTDQTPGSTIRFAVKFAYAGGMSVTKQFEYQVANSGGSQDPEPIVYPTLYIRGIGGWDGAHNLTMAHDGNGNYTCLKTGLAAGTYEFVLSTDGSNVAFTPRNTTRNEEHVDANDYGGGANFKITLSHAADVTFSVTYVSATNVSIDVNIAIDDVLPEMTSASMSSKTYNSVTIAVVASDNVGVVGYVVENDENTLGEYTPAGGKIVVTSLTAETEYTLTVYAKDAAGNVSATGVDVQFTTESAPEGQVLVNGSHSILLTPIHYTSTNLYELTITSEESLSGLGGSFWNVNGVSSDMRSSMTKVDDNTLRFEVSSTSAPNIHTPLYVIMPGEVNFGSVTLNWIEKPYTAPIEDGDNSVWYFMANGNNGAVAFSFTWNVDRTITIQALDRWVEKPCNVQVNDGDYRDFTDNSYTTTATFMRGDSYNAFIWLPYDGGVDRIDFTYTVGATNKYYTRTVTNDAYGTICLPDATEGLAGADFFDVTGVTAANDVVTGVVLSDVNALEAGKPYAFQATSAKLAAIYGSDENPVANTSFLVGNLNDSPLAVPQGAYLVLLADNKLHKIAAESIANIAKNKAYFTLNAAQATPAAGRRVIEVVDESHTATSIDNVETNETIVKFLENGKVYIRRAGVVYDVLGNVVR